MKKIKRLQQIIRWTLYDFLIRYLLNTHLMLDCDYDYVFWVDADIIFKKTITEKEVIKKVFTRGLCCIIYR